MATQVTDAEVRPSRGRRRADRMVIVSDKDGKFLRSWGEDVGFVNAHGAATGPDDMLYLTDDFGAAVRKCTPEGKVGTDHRHAGQTRTSFLRRSVQPLHPHCTLTAGGHLRFRRLPERPRPQIRARWETAVLVGRAGDRPGPVQPRAQHRLRRRRPGLCRRPREPSRAGVRRQRQIPRVSGTI